MSVFKHAGLAGLASCEMFGVPHEMVSVTILFEEQYGSMMEGWGLEMHGFLHNGVHVKYLIRKTKASVASSRTLALAN